MEQSGWWRMGGEQQEPAQPRWQEGRWRRAQACQPAAQLITPAHLPHRLHIQLLAALQRRVQKRVARQARLEGRWLPVVGAGEEGRAGYAGASGAATRDPAASPWALARVAAADRSACLTSSARPPTCTLSQLLCCSTRLASSSASTADRSPRPQRRAAAAASDSGRLRWQAEGAWSSVFAGGGFRLGEGAASAAHALPCLLQPTWLPC